MTSHSLMKQLSTRLSNEQDLGDEPGHNTNAHKDGDAKATGRLGQVAREKHRGKANCPDAFEYRALPSFSTSSVH